MVRPLALGRVRHFGSSESISDQSTCIYVDSSFCSLSSELNSSVFDSSVLSDVSENSVTVSTNKTQDTVSDSSDTFYLNDNTDNGESLKFYYTNADCLLNKIGELEILINIVKPDVMVITEVFPKSMNSANIDKNEYMIKGFTCFSGSVDENSRGVVIYVREGLNADYCSSVANKDFKESVWCELRINKTEKLLIGGVYKSPNSDAVNHVALNRMITQAVELDYKNTIIVGDFNFPEVNWDSWTVNRNENHVSFHFVECIRDNYLFQHVDFNTRYREGQDPSCLDLLLTDNENIIENLQFGDKLGASDHVSIIFNVLCNVERETNHIQRPNFFKANYQLIKDYLRQVDWNEMNDMNTEESWNFLMQKINFCIEQYVPLKQSNKKFLKPKWMDQYCVKKVKKKYHAWKRFTFSHSYAAYQEYCRLRNDATKAVRFAKRKYHKGIADSVKNSPKSFWSHVKEQTKSKSSIGDLKDKDGIIKTEDKDKAEILNDFFASVFTVEGDSELPQFEHMVNEDFLSRINIIPEKVLKQLKTLNTSKSCGPDNCHPFFLKECAEEIYLPLANIFGKSVSSGVVPNDWRQANITCIFKKGSKSEPGNYRPVSLTSVICKMLEKNVREGIIEHLSKHSLLSDRQFGFRKNRSTILQLLTVLEDWTDALDNNLQVDTVYLDFKKAFDSVPHKRLLQKLEAYGIRGELLTWLRNFLDQRKQRVMINGNYSKWTDVISGIPQGSILGPILFIVFINDLPGVVGSVCQLFADDCKMYKNITAEADQRELQEDIMRLCQWSKDWLLNFNIQKCKVVSYGNIRFEYEYKMTDDRNNQHILVSEESERDLGILFKQNLKFEEHIDNTVNKVNRIMGLIKRKFTYMDKSLFLTLYKSLVRSHLDYGNLIFYPTTKKYKQILENAQRRATRVIPELHGLSYRERLIELNLPTLDYRRKRFDIIQVFKIIHHIDDIDMNIFFTFTENSQLRGHNLKLSKPRANKSIRLNFFAIRNVPVWNSLPPDLVNAKTVLEFKTKLDRLWSEKRYDLSEIY